MNGSAHSFLMRGIQIKLLSVLGEIHDCTDSRVSAGLVFPDGSGGKESLQCRRHRRCEFDPWVGKLPWRGRWQLTPVFLPGKCQGQRSLVGYSLWGLKESDTTEHSIAHQLGWFL